MQDDLIPIDYCGTIDPRDQTISRLQWQISILKSEIEMFKAMVDVIKRDA